MLVQLPTPNADFPELEAVERHYNQKDKGTQVFRDPESRNAEVPLLPSLPLQPLDKGVPRP